MNKIKLPLYRSYDVHEDRENLYVELDPEELREFILAVIREQKMQENEE